MARDTEGLGPRNALNKSDSAYIVRRYSWEIAATVVSTLTLSVMGYSYYSENDQEGEPGVDANCIDGFDPDGPDFGFDPCVVQGYRLPRFDTSDGSSGVNEMITVGALGLLLFAITSMYVKSRRDRAVA